MATAEDCDFCEIVRREEPAREVLRTDQVVAFFPTDPATLGHTLLIPTTHLPDIWSLDIGTAQALSDATLQLAHAVRKALAPEGLNLIQSNGAAATQTVFHVHIHLVPRWTDDQMGRIWPLETNWTEDQKTSAQNKIRAAHGAASGEGG